MQFVFLLRVLRVFVVKLRAPNKMTLHSSGLFHAWLASGCIDDA